jgi:hypothetical protein
MDHPLGALELGPRLEQINGRMERRDARDVPGRLVIAPPQPGSKALAVDRPGLPVAVDLEISVCGAGGGMEQLRTARARTSGENFCLCCLSMAPSSQELEFPANPGRFTGIE